MNITLAVVKNLRIFCDRWMWGIDVACKDFEDAVLSLPIFGPFNFSMNTLVARSSRLFQSSSMSTAETWEAKLVRDIAAQLPFGELRTMIGRATRLFRSSQETEAYKIMNKAIFYARYGSDARLVLSLWKAGLDEAEGRGREAIAGLVALVEGDKRFHDHGVVDQAVVTALEADAGRYHYGLSSEYTRVERGGLAADILMYIGSLVVSVEMEENGGESPRASGKDGGGSSAFDPFRRALAWYSRCLRINPEHPEALWNRARLLIFQGDKRSAMMDLLALAKVGSRLSKQQLRMGTDGGVTRVDVSDDATTELRMSADVASGQIQVYDVLKRYERAVDHRISEKISYLCELQGELASALNALETATRKEHANYQQDNAQRNLIEAQMAMRIAIDQYLEDINGTRSERVGVGEKANEGEMQAKPGETAAKVDATLAAVRKAIYMSFPLNEDLSDIAALRKKGGTSRKVGANGGKDDLSGIAQERARKAARKGRKRRRKRRKRSGSLKRKASGAHLRRTPSSMNVRKRRAKRKEKQRQQKQRPMRPQGPRRESNAGEEASRGWRLQHSRSRSNSVASSAGESDMSSWSDSSMASEFSEFSVADFDAREEL